MQPILGTIFGLVVWLVMSSGLFVWLKQASDSIKVTGAAMQAQVISGAFARYVKDHGAALATTATAVQAAKVTVADLRTGGYLPTSVSDKNVFGQDWVAQVLQPQPGQLQTLLFSTGGQAIPARQLVPIAAQASSRGNLGGFVPYRNQAGDTSLQPDVAVGTGGSFRQSLTNYAGGPGSGHLAMMLSVADAKTDNGYLYRVDMKPSRPDLNSMQTDLGMTGTDGTKHDINGANTVGAVTGKFSGTIGTNGLDPTQGLPQGWGGGVHTWDVYGEGTVAAGKDGQIAAGLNREGSVWGKNTTTETLNANANATSCTWNDSKIVNNKLYICTVQGQWAGGSTLVGNQTVTGIYTGYKNGWGINPPVCGTGGTPYWSMALQSSDVDFSKSNPPIAGNAVDMGWNGSQWVVMVYNVLADGQNTMIPDRFGLQVNVQIGCTFKNT